MQKPKISILMLNWNTSVHTIECLKSFQKQKMRDFEVVLVDNGSELRDYENLKSDVKKLKIKIILKRLARNAGITGGMNFGYKFVSGSHVVFMNNDMIVTPNFLSELVAPFERYSDVGAVVPKVKFWDGGPTKEVQFSGGNLTFYGTLMNKDLEKYGSRVHNKESEVGCATAACLLVSRDALNKIGEVFPPFYSLYFEDIDLSWRIGSAGFKIIYAPKSVVYHKGSMSINFNKTSVSKWTLMTRNKYLTFWRNLPLGSFLIVLPFMIAFDVLKSVKQIARGRFGLAGAYLRGFAEFVAGIGKVRTPRLGKLSDLSWDFEGAGSVRSSWSKR